MVNLLVSAIMSLPELSQVSSKFTTDIPRGSASSMSPNLPPVSQAMSGQSPATALASLAEVSPGRSPSPSPRSSSPSVSSPISCFPSPLISYDVIAHLSPAQLSKLKEQLLDFLHNCTKNWEEGSFVMRFQLFREVISCVLWEGKFHITGTDIVRCVAWRFRLDGIPISDQKKFEEGIFSDLRNLKPGTDATLEEPRSKFLDFLFKLNCIRTHKKQKVFYWHSVPHEKLFQEALRRERKREINPVIHSLLSLATNQADTRDHPTKRPRLDEDFHGMDGAEACCNIYSEGNYGAKYKQQLHYHQHLQPRSGESSFFLFPSNNAAPSPSGSCTTSPESSFGDPASPEATNKLAPNSIGLALLGLSQVTQSEAEQSPNSPPESPSSSSPERQPENSRRPYACTHPNCGRVFRRLQHLKRHRLIHSGERPFQCPELGCGRWFSRADNLSQHIKIHGHRPQSS